MINTAYAIGAYTQTKVTTAYNPLDLVIMLYDGAIEFLDKSAAAINMKEVQIKVRYIDKALAIIEELHNTLNMDAGGEVSLNLRDLYSYMMREIVFANASNDADKIKHVIDLLKEVKEGWVEIKGKV